MTSVPLQTLADKLEAAVRTCRMSEATADLMARQAEHGVPANKDRAVAHAAELLALHGLLRSALSSCLRIVRSHTPSVLPAGQTVHLGAGRGAPAVKIGGASEDEVPFRLKLRPPEPPAAPPRSTDDLTRDLVREGLLRPSAPASFPPTLQRDEYHGAAPCP